MPDMTDYLSSVSVGTKVSTMTGRTEEGFVAGGFSAFVQSVTGRVPAIVQLPDNKVKIVLDEEQIKLMRKWLDSQVSLIFKPSKDQKLFIEMNPVVIPWALKYFIPLVALLLIAGGIVVYGFSK